VKCAASALKVEEGGECIFRKNKLFGLNIQQFAAKIFLIHKTGVAVFVSAG
jgi:hypothetical protein